MGLRFVIAIVLAGAVAPVMAGVTAAQTNEPAPVHAAPAGDWTPVRGAPVDEQVDASKLVVAAYAAFFVLMFGYTIAVAARQKKLAKEFVDLARRIDERARGS